MQAHEMFNLPPHLLLKTPLSSSPATGVMNVDSLNDLLEGFRFLHTKVKYIHRDIEDKHVGRSKTGQLCMFDLDTSVALGASSPGVSLDGSLSLPAGYAGETDFKLNGFDKKSNQRVVRCCM